MKAGFALAALLLDDRELDRVEPALPDALLPGLRAQLAQSRDQEGGVAGLLRALHPQLTSADVRQLPPRMSALLARLLPVSARKALMADAPASRPDFVPDEPLLRVLARIARLSNGAPGT